MSWNVVPTVTDEAPPSTSPRSRFSFVSTIEVDDGFELAAAAACVANPRPGGRDLLAGRAAGGSVTVHDDDGVPLPARLMLVTVTRAPKSPKVPGVVAEKFVADSATWSSGTRRSRRAGLHRAAGRDDRADQAALRRPQDGAGGRRPVVGDSLSRSMTLARRTGRQLHVDVLHRRGHGVRGGTGVVAMGSSTVLVPQPPWPVRR